MNLKVFSVRDSKAGVYNTPFFQHQIGEAERTFRKLVNDNQSMISQFPDDYDLYYLGDYDDQTGVINALQTPQHIVKAVNLMPLTDVAKKTSGVRQANLNAN